MNLKNIYESINNRLDDVNFDQIITGFSPCSFAIFDDEQAIVDGEIIDKPKQFIANSVAQYKDSLVATFYHDFLPKELNKATSLIVHEMFHVFQFSKKEYHSLLKNNSEKNGIFYDYTADNITLKYNEVEYLIDAYLNGSEEDYRRFLSFRFLRNSRYPKETLYENATELIEGFASYVELKTLKQLDEKLFSKELIKTIKSLADIESYFSIRELSYKVGALMLLTLDKLKINFENAIQGKSFISEVYNFDYVEAKIKNRIAIQSLMDKKSIEKKNLILEFFSMGYCKIDFDEVIGYNPMGIIRSDNKLLVKFLIIIKVDKQERILNGDFCLICDDNREFIELYKSTALKSNQTLTSKN